MSQPARSEASGRRAFLSGSAALLGAAGAGRMSFADPVSNAACAILGARVHPADGRRIDDAAIVIQGTRIVAVGPRGEVKIPGGARIIDGKDLWVTPGLFDADSMTGAVDVWLENTARDVGLSEAYDPVRAAYRAIDGWNPRSVVIPTTRIEGVTTVALTPRGGLVAGQGAVVRLWGRDRAAMTVVAPSAVYVDAGAGGRQVAFGVRGGVMLRLRELLDDVRLYMKRKQDFERRQMRDLVASRLDLEALIPVVERALPLVIEVSRASDIEAFLSFAADEKLRVVFSGCDEGWLVADRLAEAGVPVITNALANLPRDFDALGARLENVARLTEAGVKVCVTAREAGSHDSRTLRFQAGNAVSNGLSWEHGLAAVTRNPAEVFGVAAELGTLAPGKLADLVVWSGDPFEPLTRPRYVFIGGAEVPLVSRQTQLRDRYRGK